MQLAPAPGLVERFASGLDPLVPPETRIGLAVSGGPDSVALLLLAAATRPGRVEAATVDHKLRPEAAAEAEFVAGLCERLQVPHATLDAQWDEQPATALQERARRERYRLLGDWMRDRGLGTLATAHHMDDQAETLLMRLNRGAGVRGLGGIRAVAPIPGGDGLLVRPLLGWSRAELGAVCEGAGIVPVEDPSNSDGRFERVRVRKRLAETGLFDTQALARSAANLAAADEALDWVVDCEWELRVERKPRQIVYTPGAAPNEIRRRVAARAIEALASEGADVPLRGRELDQLMDALGSRGTATLRGVRCSGGECWSFAPASPRRS